MKKPLHPTMAAGLIVAGALTAWLVNGIVSAQTTPGGTTAPFKVVEPTPAPEGSSPELDRRKAVLQREIWELYGVADYLEARLMAAERDLASRRSWTNPNASQAGPSVTRPVSPPERESIQGRRVRDLTDRDNADGEGAFYGRQVPFIRNVTVDDRGRIILDYGSVPTGTSIRPNERRLEE